MLLEKLEFAFANSAEFFVFTCWLPNGLWIITQHAFHGDIIPMSNPSGFMGLCLEALKPTSPPLHRDDC